MRHEDLFLNHELNNELIDKAYKEVNTHQETVKQDPYRLHYHIMPPVGLLNDPNGFVFFKGKYHLFYQWNPFATTHGPKFWGHLTSTNLINWEEQAIALAPGDWFDKNGCYSGSAVVHEDELYLFYTGNVRDEDGNRETYQCLATSRDGVNFEKRGPVIPLPSGYTAHFRDPKVWKNEECWFMIIGAQKENLSGSAVLYKSTNLLEWELLGPITQKNNFGYMWECPDLFSLNNKDVLLFSPQGIEPEGYKYWNIYQSGYMVGELDYSDVTFNHGTFEELDRGFDFYAPQTTIDGKNRRLLFGWMGVPEENEQDHPTIEYKWIHAMTLPRQLELVGEKVFQKPVDELTELRGNHTKKHHVIIKDSEKSFPDFAGNVKELTINIRKMMGQNFSVCFGKNTRVSFNVLEGLFSFQRKSFKNNTVEERHCTLKSLNSLRVFLDTSSIEIFVNGGEEVFTSRIFDDLSKDEVSIKTIGEVVIDMDKWDLLL
ncbi:glycoside hydrolase family 32 protein [Aquibacillus kalidii]|uniref:glycoside hydrolase family 32 protein n=1 Tax=Aquibacillus kalidii TaxID=2762597 RepID=UPI0016492790|nr:sucrose-6-phosphate hydrolase [Aquibacillus kalidii]